MRWLERFRRAFVAASFAEAGEWDEAREFLKERQTLRSTKRPWQRTTRRSRPRPRIYRA